MPPVDGTTIDIASMMMIVVVVMAVALNCFALDIVILSTTVEALF